MPAEIPGTSIFLLVNATPIIFVIDDNISVRNSLAAVIRFKGWQIETFLSAQEFLAWPWRATGRPCRSLARRRRFGNEIANETQPTRTMAALIRADKRQVKEVER